MSHEARARRLADRIKEIAAGTIERQVKDPRLGFVTVTDVKLTGDLRDATIYYTVYGDETARADSALALDSARGLIRTEVGRGTGVRYTPSISFRADEVPADAAHVEELLARARAADAELHRVAEGARPAGDPDPYRHPITDEPADEVGDEPADEVGDEPAGEVGDEPGGDGGEQP